MILPLQLVSRFHTTMLKRVVFTTAIVVTIPSPAVLIRAGGRNYGSDGEISHRALDGARQKESPSIL